MELNPVALTTEHGGGIEHVDVRAVELEASESDAAWDGLVHRS